MKRGVERGHLSRRGKLVAHGVDARERGRHVERIDVQQRFERKPNFAIDDDCVTELCAAVHHAVSNGVEAGQLAKRRTHLLRPAIARARAPLLFPGLNRRALVSLEQRPFECARSGIQHEYAHVTIPFSSRAGENSGQRAFRFDKTIPEQQRILSGNG